MATADGEVAAGTADGGAYNGETSPVILNLFQDLTSHVEIVRS
jgi:hypothetical protein